MKPCPKCSGLAIYSSHFGAYICSTCGWADETPGTKRVILARLVNGDPSRIELEFRQPKDEKTEPVSA